MDVYSPSGVTTGLPTGATTPTTGKLDTLDFSYTGAITEIGKNGANYFDGIISNVSLYLAGVLIRYYRIDSTFSSKLGIADSLLTPVEMWNDDPTSVAAEWVVNGDGSYTCTSGSNSILRDDDNLLETSEEYFVQYSIDSVSSGSCRVLLYSDVKVGLGTSNSSAALYAEWITISTTTSSGNATGGVRVQALSGFTGVISSVSVEHNGNTGKAEAITSTDAQNYTFNGDVSPNTWTGDDATVIEVAGT